jgi:secreted PhoX family phosphatase
MNKILAIAIGSALATSAMALDFGQKVEALAKAQSLSLFGTIGTLGASSTASIDAATVNSNPTALVTAAPGLTVTAVSNAANLGVAIDMMVLWPNDTNPTHIIACNESAGPTGAGGVQRIRLSDGFVENIIDSPLTSCDPAEITPWGTVIVGEENGSNGRAFEILDPLTTTGVTVSGTGAATTTSDTTRVRYLGALGQLSYEGISIMPNGVVYYQDENRPSATDNGGGYFKFIPTTLWTGNAPITDLNNSPLVAGRVFGLRLGRNGGNADIGAGTHAGRGNWVEVVDGQVIGSTTVNRINLRAAATALKLTTGYRPEDQDIDKRAQSLGNVRICGTNTGQDTATTSANGANFFGETFCFTDGTIAQSAVINTVSQTLGGVAYTVNSGAGTSIPEYQLLVSHFLDFGMPDNIAYQPGRGNWIIHEDGDGATYAPPRNNDIWSCVDDGADKDLLADACAKIITINDLTAETTGGVFNSAGNEFYFSVQHNVSGHGTIVKVTGWQ